MLGNFLEEVVGLIPELFKKEEAWLIIFLLLIGGFISFSVFQFNLSVWDIPLILWNFLKATWWFLIFFPLFSFFQSVLLFWRQEEYKEELSYVFMEVKIPREILKSPKAMEQVLLICHSLRNAATNVKAEYYEGETTANFGFEIVSIGGESHFFIRCLKKYKHVVESAFFSYYPDVELIDVQDYAERLPQTPESMYRMGLKVWGIELTLAKSAMFPIRTYPSFEIGGETGHTDPLSAFLEVLGKVRPQEFFGVQILAIPSDSHWADGYKEELEEYRQKITGKPDDDGETKQTPQPQRMEILKSIENNISKPAFEVVVRLMYLAPANDFSDKFIRRGIISAFNQYALMNANSFRQNFPTGTRVEMWYPPYIFSNRRGEYRRQRLLYNYVRRETPQDSWIGKFLTSNIFNWNFYSEAFLLNVESLATIFHLPPALVLTSPHIQRVESRKAGPSAGLPIFGEETDIEQFY